LLLRVLAWPSFSSINEQLGHLSVASSIASGNSGNTTQ